MLINSPNHNQVVPSSGVELEVYFMWDVSKFSFEAESRLVILLKESVAYDGLFQGNSYRMTDLPVGSHTVSVLLYSLQGREVLIGIGKATNTT